ncbi:MAG TPA: translation initiation factor IF-2 [Parachlamydiales bacterium]|nr:translation initiation factor IF-2 [Parachlamydiales bacterium]
MGKNLKLNIKNTQLAEALKAKKAPSEQPAAAPKKQEATAAGEEPKKLATRLKEDTTVVSALKQAEKTLAAREKEKETLTAVDPLKKRKTRLVQATPVEEEIKEEPAVIKSVEKEPPSPVFVPSEEPEETKPIVAAPLVKPPEAATGEPAKAPSKEELPELKQIGELAPRKALPAKDLRTKKPKEVRSFDARDRQGLRAGDDEAWRKKRAHKQMRRHQEEIVIRPKELSVRLPITIKDLAHEMKLKASQLIAKLFMQGIIVTLNDYLDDETVVQLLGHEFDCTISIDTSEQKRIQITDRTIRQEIDAAAPGNLILRAPVVAFMGHVDHGKTSLIDTIRKSNRASQEAGAITQHIGAFKVKTNAGEVTILDTPGHEAFSEMRTRGANVTDIVILVVAGDEGIKAQTEEAIRQAREANVPILVAINKCDKPNFDEQKIYRELADRDLLPESWGGSIITVNCSAVSGVGVPELLEMIALQAEILELRANPESRARGTVLESEMHKGLGAVATVLIQNGTLRKGDAIVFGHHSGRIKTMQDDHGKPIESAGPSTPVKITGLSELALAGNEFIVVKNEKEARELADARSEGRERHLMAQAKIGGLEKLMQKRESGEKKILPLILRADVQGSLEALKTSLMKIHSNKVRLEIVNADVGEISESDISLAAASKATIVGFHTTIESHADDLIKQKKVPIYTQDVIYHLIDEVKNRMRSLLDKLEKETDTGAALVKAAFKSSQLGVIAGCQITDGIIKRSSLIRQIRGKEIIWKGKVASLKRLKEDVKEVKEGFECGILLEGQSDIKEGDVLQAYEITYLEQDL